MSTKTCEMMVNIVLILLIVYILLGREVDENGMDNYDRQYGIAGNGKTRGILGTVYDKKGNVDGWSTLTDTNPLWF